MITGRINQVIVRLRVRPRLRRAGRSLCVAEATFRRPSTLVFAKGSTLHSEMTAFELATAQPPRRASGCRAARSTFMLAFSLHRLGRAKRVAQAPRHSRTGRH